MRKLFLNFVLVLYCYCGDTVKQGLFSKHLFPRKQQHGNWKKPQTADKLLQNIMSSSYQVELKTFIEASCTNGK